MTFYKRIQSIMFNISLLQYRIDHKKKLSVCHNVRWCKKEIETIMFMSNGLNLIIIINLQKKTSDHYFW